MWRQSASYGDLVRKDAVHGSVYQDPSIFAEEMDRIYSQGWTYIGHESEVPNTGDFKRKAIGVQPVILCRDDDEKIQVLFNRCRHRAATVCQLDRGNAKQFRCEYHGWTYGLNGALANVPYADAYVDLDKTALSLAKPSRVESYRGFVFASMTPSGRDLLEHLGKPATE